MRNIKIKLKIKVKAKNRPSSYYYTLKVSSVIIHKAFTSGGFPQSPLSKETKLCIISKSKTFIAEGNEF